MLDAGNMMEKIQERHFCHSGNLQYREKQINSPKENKFGILNKIGAIPLHRKGS